jgi:spore coat protein U-like protein
MHRWAKFSTAVVAATVIAATNVSAQANINVSANVFQAISVSGAEDLDFGNVFPGVAKTIAVGDGGAGRFDATGQASANVNMTFTLPASLAGPGGNTLTIGSWAGCTNPTNTTVSCTAFVPAATAVGTQFGNPGNLFIWIGATVSPTPTQAAGSYTGTVQLTLAYF